MLEHLDHTDAAIRTLEDLQEQLEDTRRTLAIRVAKLL